MIEAFVQNLTIESFISVIAGLAQIAAVTLIPVGAWILARRAGTKIHIRSESQKILNEPGRYVWKITVFSRREFVNDVRFLIRSYSSQSDIELVGMEAREKGILVDSLNSYISVNLPIIFVDRPVIFHVKFSQMDHPSFVSVSKGIRIESDISWPKRLVKKAVLLSAQQRLMILMLQFVMAIFLIIAVIIFRSFSG